MIEAFLKSDLMLPADSEVVPISADNFRVRFGAGSPLHYPPRRL